MAFLGFWVSSPSAPAPSNPAKARKPKTEPRIERVQVDPGRQAEDAGGDRAGVQPVAVPDLHQDDHHQHEDEGDRDGLDVEQGAGRPLDHPGAERPDDHGDRQGQDDPVGPLPPAQVLQHAGQEVAGRGGRGGHEHEVHQAHGPAREHPGPRPERGADEAVDRPGVVVLPGQQHVPVADEAAGHAGEHERQRGPAADQRGHPRARERHGQRRGHRADGQADRLPHVQVALQPVPPGLARRREHLAPARPGRCASRSSGPPPRGCYAQPQKVNRRSQEFSPGACEIRYV